MTAVAASPSRSRLYHRAEVVTRALALRTHAQRRPPVAVRRILIAHHLLLGDTLMLTPLLAKLREQHQDADVTMTVPRACAALYASRPYGVTALPWDPRRRDPSLFAQAPFDLAFVPGDNRYAWLAAAMNARWIVAFGGAGSLRKDWPIDALVPYAQAPAAWGDMVAAMAAGPAPAPFDPRDWPAPAATPFAQPAAPYAVLHVGASTPLKQWPADRWQALAAWLQDAGVTPVWSGGRGEDRIVAACDPDGRHASYAGRLDLAQMWHLVAGARLVVTPDTGVAHLGRIVATPTVTLFGPGSAVVTGAGEFWRNARYRAVTVDPFPCRDQQRLFGRTIGWVRRCGRSPAECATPRCMQAIGRDLVERAIVDLGVLA
jgi:ADP-heptose:LPS heptosyltransferase